MTSHLTFSETTPMWLKILVRRWYRKLRLHDWRVEIDMAQYDELQGGDDELIQAITYPLPEYLRAKIVFSEELDRETAEEFVIHELLHLHLAGVELIFCQCWDGRKRLDRKAALRLVNDTVETIIERMVKVLL